MREYPSTAYNTFTDILDEIIELRDEDIIEFNNIAENVSFQSSLTPKASSKAIDVLFGEDDYTIALDASGGARVASLPSNPTNGRLCTLIRVNSGINTVTLSGNGKNINGSGTFVLMMQYDSVTVQYIGGSDQWIIISS